MGAGSKLVKSGLVKELTPIEAFGLSEWGKMTPSQRITALAAVKANAKRLSQIRKNIKQRKQRQKASNLKKRKSLGVKR